MIISIQVETHPGGHTRHVLDVGEGDGRDPVQALGLSSSHSYGPSGSWSGTWTGKAFAPRRGPSVAVVRE
jgi:hypothetical protein